MKCEICGTELKALFTSNYCPNEDKHAPKFLGKEYVLSNPGYLICNVLEENSVKEITCDKYTVSLKNLPTCEAIKWVFISQPISYITLSLMS